MLEHLTLAERVMALAATTLGLLGLVLAYTRRIRPIFKRVVDTWSALTELLFGRPAEEANPITGAPPVPAVLGIGPRLAAQENAQAAQAEQMTVLTNAVAKLVDNEHRLAALESRVSILEDARVERVVAQAESAAMWSAVDREQHADPSPSDQPAADPPRKEIP